MAKSLKTLLRVEVGMFDDSSVHDAGDAIDCVVHASLDRIWIDFGETTPSFSSAHRGEEQCDAGTYDRPEKEDHQSIAVVVLLHVGNLIKATFGVVVPVKIDKRFIGTSRRTCWHLPEAIAAPPSTSPRD